MTTHDDRDPHWPTDLEALKQLKARYFRFIDTKQWDAFREVFARDGVLEVASLGVHLEGRDAIAESVSRMLDGAISVHHGHMPEIEPTGRDTARGTWSMFDAVEWPAEGSEPTRGFRGYGHYEDAYVREEGVWRIRHTRLTRLRVDPITG